MRAVVTERGTSRWSFCSRLTAIHADIGDARAASIRPGMGQFTASMRREMDVPEQVEAYLASQPEPKQADLRRLHAHILAEFPGCRLWFTDGTNADGKVVANPNIGYGACTITYADGWFTHVRLLVAHLTRCLRAFSATLTTPALYRRSLRWFELPACTANPEDLPPSLAQHGSCRRPSTPPHSPFRTHHRTADILLRRIGAQRRA